MASVQKVEIIQGYDRIYITFFHDIGYRLKYRRVTFSSWKRLCKVANKHDITLAVDGFSYIIYVLRKDGE